MLIQVLGKQLIICITALSSGISLKYGNFIRNIRDNLNSQGQSRERENDNHNIWEL
jgi:hypothetical protein